MKSRVMGLILIMVMSALLLAGCGSKDAEEAKEETETQTEEVAGEDAEEATEEATEETEEETQAEEGQSGDAINIVALKGPTAMGMIKMMDDSDKGEAEGNWNFQLAAAPDEVAPLIIQGQVDIAAVPANLAATLYNKTEGKVKVLTVNTLGVLYIVEKGESVSSVSDLAGKTIYASGQGATPEYALNYILKENGLDPESDVTVEWKSEHAECLAALNAAEEGIAMLPQPFVTVAMGQAEGLRVALDLTEEWERVQEGKDNPSKLLTGATIVRSEFAEENPEALAQFLAAYEESVNFVNSDNAAAAEIIGAYDIVPAQVAEKALPACNIVYMAGSEMKTALSGYLEVLFGENPQSVGGNLPTDDFYYE